jgi:hypothetical protein
MATQLSVDTLPLEGRDQGWGCKTLHILRIGDAPSTPHPNPPPQGGRECLTNHPAHHKDH